MSTLISSRILHAPANHHRSGLRSSWLWPLPRLDGEAPCILASDRADSTDTLELGYPSRSLSRGLVPVFAAQDGIVTYASSAESCPTLSIDHPGGWTTHYDDLEHLLARPTDRFRGRRKERVRAGDVIGHARPLALRIRFAVSRPVDDGSDVRDLSTWMPEWAMAPWFAELAGPALGDELTLGHCSRRDGKP